MTRIAVFSDIHFGQLSRTDFFAAPGEKIKDNSIGDKPLGEGLIMLLKEMKPDCFFIAGDLTSAAEPQEFYYCEKKIIELADTVGVKRENIICCTGNHDVDWKISKLSPLEEGHFENNNEIETLRCNKYQEIAAHVAEICFEDIKGNVEKMGPAPFSGVHERNDFIVFVLNTGWHCGPNQKYSHGELTKKQLDWFIEKTKDYIDDDRKKIVLMHHHPFNYPYPNIGEEISQIKEGPEFIEIAEENGIDIVIHGHRHHPKVKTELREGCSPLTYFCAGSLSVNAEHRSNGEIPNTMHFIDIDKTKDYFVLYNYSYTGTEGWKKTTYSATTPLDDVMRVGKVYTKEECINKVREFANSEEQLIHLEWNTIDEAIRFQTYNEVMEIVNAELGGKYEIIGRFPERVMLLRKGVV